MPPTATNSGIVKDEASGERHIPESLRADGTTRKAIKIRPGFQPAEDIELYRARNAVAQRERRRIGVPGADAARDEKPQVPGAAEPTKGPNRSTTLSWRREDDNTSTTASASTSAASNKNAKRREARKKAKSTDLDDAASLMEAKAPRQPEPPKTEEADPDAERDKRVRSLKKKLKQAKELKTRGDKGQGLLPEQIAKVIKINELIRELKALGIDDDDGEMKKDAETVSEAAAA